MWPYLRLPQTNSCQIWCVRVFHHVLLKYCHANPEMQKRNFDDVTLQYSIDVTSSSGDISTTDEGDDDCTRTCRRVRMKTIKSKVKSKASTLPAYRYM